MAGLTLVGTLLGKSSSFTTNIADLSLVRTEAGLVLVAANRQGGGLSTFEIGDADTLGRFVGHSAYGKTATWLGEPVVTTIAMPAGVTAYAAGLGSGFRAGIAFDASGSITGRSGATLPVTVTSASSFEQGSGRYVVLARAGGTTVETWQVSDTGAGKAISAAAIPSGRGAQINDITIAEMSGANYAITASTTGGFVSAHRIDDAGRMGVGQTLGVSWQAPFSKPTHVEAIDSGSRQFVVVAGAGSNSLTTLQLNSDGLLKPVDHILDERTTRFAAVTELAGVNFGGRGYVFAAGADDGISMFLVLPDGRLVHIANVADSNNVSLNNVSALAAEAYDGRIVVAAASATEGGIAQFTVDPGDVGATFVAGAGAARGSASDDVITASAATTSIDGGDGNDTLAAGTGAVRLTGGAGADLFLPTAVSGRITITDFNPAEDRLDLSNLGMIRTTQQMTVRAVSDGLLITYGATTLRIVSADGNALSARVIRNESFPIAHYPTPGEPVTLTGTPGPDLLLAGVNRLFAFGLAGKDTIEGGYLADQLSGGDSGDVIRGWSGGDTILGGTGRDKLYGGSGHDQIKGDADDDTIYGEMGHDVIYGGTGLDVLIGGVDNDSLYGDSATDRLYGEDGDDLLSGGTGNDTLSGGAGNDLLTDTQGNNALAGGSGNDQLLGGSGRDVMTGGSGRDTLKGYADNDALRGGDDRDTLMGGLGNDFMMGEADHDLLLGDVGNDTLSGGDGNDWLKGGDGDDRIAGGEGNDTLEGDKGNDYLSGENGNDRMLGRSGNDTLLGVGGNDWIDGETGSDVIRGGIGNDRIDGGEDRDDLRGESGNDQLFGGNGNDLIKGDAGHDRLSGGNGDDHLFGGNDNDTISGESGNDRLVGENGHDRIRGDGGNDILVGDGGDDVLDGGFGNDTLSGGAGNDRLLGNNGRDTVAGGDGNDTTDGGNDHDSLTGENGQDRLGGAGGNDTIRGGNGNDTLGGGVGEDKLFGDAGNDSLLGEAWRDVLSGGEGDDYLSGGDSNDTLAGGGGNDRLVGGVGSDQLNGGGGADRFVFLRGDAGMGRSRDTIADFQHGADRIDLRGLHLDFVGERFTGQDDQLIATRAGNGVLVTADLNGDGRGDMSIFVDRVTHLAADDFLL